MTKELEIKIEGLYNLCMDKPLKILNIFNNFFGESRVDLQGFKSFEDFKFWISNTKVFEYIPRKLLNVDIEEYDIYINKSLTQLDKDSLNKVISLLHSNEVIENIKASFTRGFILVHFPHVRVTNEYDRYVDITHLYALVPINLDGSGTGHFSLNRAEYSYLHISNHYMHSHVNSIPTHNFSEFQNPCTGSGPINITKANLAREYDETLWELFCLELDKFVQVESIAGTPYHRLENLGISNMNNEFGAFEAINNLGWWRHFDKIMAASFTKYLIENKKLKFNYKSGSYSIGMSFVEFMVLISNQFIDWYNQSFNEKKYTYTLNNFINEKIVRKCIISGNKIYYESVTNNIDTYKSYIGKKVCTFKGKDVLLNISGIEELDDNNKTIILNPRIALYIITKILNIVNYKYGKAKQRGQEGNTISEKIKFF